VSAWPVRAPSGSVPACDGAETYFGEGEVAWPQIVSWNHTMAAVWMPAGVGQRAVSVLVGEQAPVTPITAANWMYYAPRLSVATVAAAAPSMTGGYVAPPGTISTDGGSVINLQGWYLPRLWWNASAPGDFPAVLPAPDGTIPATQTLALRWGATNLRRLCDPSSVAAAATLSCLASGPVVSSGSTGWVSPQHGDGFASTTLPPGLGGNVSLSVEVWDSAGLIAASEPLYFSYGNPLITQVRALSKLFLVFPFFRNSASSLKCVPILSRVPDPTPDNLHHRLRVNHWGVVICHFSHRAKHRASARLAGEQDTVYFCARACE
jgi:hypothetical protein